MRMEVAIAEASSALCQVPVCVGCHRSAIGAGRILLSTAAGLPVGTTSGDGIGAIVGLLVLGAGILGWAVSNKVAVRYPACAWHRWCLRPPLRLVAVTGGRAVLEGVSAEFLAAWQAVSGDGSSVYDTEPDAAPERRGT